MPLDVLIADQDPELAELYGAFLADHGFTTRAVSGGLACLGLVRQQRPRLLVLDNELPWGDGAGVLACLRQDRFPLPVILTTWTTNEDRFHAMLTPPVVVCLHKFFPLPTLLGAVGYALSGDGMDEAAVPVRDDGMTTPSAHALKYFT